MDNSGVFPTTGAGYLVLGTRHPQTSDRPIEARTHLTPGPAAPAQARRFVRDVLRQWNQTPVADVVTLLTSELVTNAILHAGSEVDISLCATDGIIRVEVADASPRIPEPAGYRVDAQTGRGLAVVAAQAHDWGTQRTRNGKIVWFEVRP